MVDPTPTPAPASDAPVEASSSPTAPEAQSGLFDMTGVTPEAAQALQAAYGHLAVDAPASDAAPTAAPAADEAALEAVPEADDEGDDEADESSTSTEPKSDRRQRRIETRQAAEAARKAEIDQAVSAALAAREQAAQDRAALDARNAEDQRVMREASELMGNTADEDALIEAVSNGDFEAADRLKALRKAKADAGVLATAFDKMAWAKLGDQIWSADKISGVDSNLVHTAKSIPEIYQHIEAVVEKRTAAEWSAKLERQKADYESRLGRAASQLPTTETGGRAVGASSLPSLAEVQAMFRSGDWRRFTGREEEIMAAYQRGQLK